MQSDTVTVVAGQWMGLGRDGSMGNSLLERDGGRDLHIFLQAIVWAKEDPCSSTSPAVEGLVRVHRYVLDNLVSFSSESLFRSTRLLIGAEQASSLLRSMAFWNDEDEKCFLSVYLTDNKPYFSDGDVIIELLGIPECANKVVREIASHLRHIPLDERVISKFERQVSILPRGDSVGNDTMESFRSYEVRHSIRIPFHYVDCIIGEKGANIETIQRSSSATVILSPATSDKVNIEINGDSFSDVEAAEEVMEGFIAEEGSPFFKCMIRCEIQLRSPEEEEEWY